jgi:Transcription factor/nuclear export subunit protein 2/Transcription- and export-related complex subunit/THO complex subunit 2 N-terminus
MCRRFAVRFQTRPCSFDILIMEEGDVGTVSEEVTALIGSLPSVSVILDAIKASSNPLDVPTTSPSSCPSHFLVKLWESVVAVPQGEYTSLPTALHHHVLSTLIRLHDECAPSSKHRVVLVNAMSASIQWVLSKHLDSSMHKGWIYTTKALLDHIGKDITAVNPLAESLLIYIPNVAFLESIGLLTNASSATAEQLLNKRLRITNTALNYRQYKFNLMVEETEGYAKLFYFLTAPSSLSLLTSTKDDAVAVDLQPLYSTLHTIMGSYHLDPNRCLDLVVDLLEYELVESSLYGTYLSNCFLPLSQSVESSNNSKEPGEEEDSNVSSQRLQFLGYCIYTLRATTKLPQLLGFKLSCRRRPTDSATCQQFSALLVPSAAVHCVFSSLLYCVAWLCVQYVPDVSSSSLLDPTTMLSYMPDAEGDDRAFEDILQSIYEESLQSEQARIRAVGRVSLTAENASATNVEDVEMSGATKSRVLERHLITQWIMTFVHYQRYAEIQSILAPDQWSMLSFLLPDSIGVAILDSTQRYVSECLSIVNDTDPDAESSTVPWSVPLVPKTSDRENAPTVPTIGDVLRKVVDPIMCTMESGCIAMRPVLYCQLCRLFSKLLSIQQNDRKSDSTGTNESISGDEFLSTEFLSFLESCLVPSLCAFHSNPAMSMELWSVLQQLPYQTRYVLYEAWRGNGLEQRPSLTASSSSNSSKPLWLMEGELRIGKDARYALKRLSKDTIRDMSRAVAKCCHSHPLVVFSTILNQIESYDNLVQVMVDACRFVTPLSLDVLGYCILQRLSVSSDGDGSSADSRSRLKANGVNVSQWLQSLESFIGAFYKRFPLVEFQGLLFYLLQRLKGGNVSELGVLRTLLKNGAGWSFADYSPAESLSTTQLEGRAGSTRLKRETMTFGVVSDIHLSASNEVRRVLQNKNIGVSLLILLAQVRHSIIFQKTDRPIPVKLIGNLVDSSQVVMSILLDFLTNELDPSGAELNAKGSAIYTYASSLPTLVDLQNLYKLDVSSAWKLCRPLMRAAQLVSNAGDSIDNALTEFLSSSIHPDLLSSMAPESTWKHISTDLFEFFFASSLYDIFCPNDVYESEIARLERESERLSQKKTVLPPTTIQPGAAPEKTDREEYERVTQMVSGLKLDFAEQKIHVITIQDSMALKLEDFFVSDTVSSASTMAFFARCIYPRCMQSPDDAMFCAQFVSLLHQHATPGFGTLHYFDALILSLPRSLFCLTEGEAACAAILLLETWKTVSRWRYDDSAFESELVGKPGSYYCDDSEKNPVAVSKEVYEKLYNKWHAAIGDTLVGCLQSKEYMHLRCGLIVLTRIVEEYPTRPKLANRLLSALEPLAKENNAFADIRASSQAYSMQLLRSRDNGVWKEEDEATVQARLALVEAAAAERHKKAEAQMAQIKRDSEKITEEIGVSEMRSRGRGPFNAADDRSSRVSGGEINRRRLPSGGPAEDTGRSFATTAPADAASSSGGRTLEGRWQHAASSSTTPPRSSITSASAAAGSDYATRKRSRPSSPAEPGETTAREEVTKRPKINPPPAPEMDNKRPRGRSTGARRI